jgi:hypothetical protein
VTDFDVHKQYMGPLFACAPYGENLAFFQANIISTHRKLLIGFGDGGAAQQASKPK